MDEKRRSYHWKKPAAFDQLDPSSGGMVAPQGIRREKMLPLEMRATSGSTPGYVVSPPLSRSQPIARAPAIGTGSNFPGHTVVDDALLHQQMGYDRRCLAAIFENASDGIVILDAQRRITAYNAAMEQLTGWRTHEVIGLACEGIHQCHSESGASLCDVACPILRTMVTHMAQAPIETRILKKDGRSLDVAMSTSFIPSPKADEVYGVAIMRDISKTKEVERLKSQFISTVSHELRTPLASIKASIGVALASLPPDTPEPLRRLLLNIDRSGDHLERVVSDLLDMARLQSGQVRLDLQRLDAREIVTSAAAMIGPLLDEKQQRLELRLPGSPVSIVADLQRLSQVMLNLLSNAYKYSVSGSSIEVSLVEEPGHVVYAVRDAGPGIPLGEQSLVFERFYRSDSQEAQRVLGAGLGLPIARALVELHGGTIWLESEPGRGSTFYFALPKRAARQVNSRALALAEDNGAAN